MDDQIEATVRGRDNIFARKTDRVLLTSETQQSDHSDLLVDNFGDDRPRETGAETFEETENQLRLMIDRVPTLAWSCRPDGTTEFLNQRWLDYTGLSMQQALGWGWKDPIHPDDLKKLMETWSRLLTSGEPGEEEARLRRFDGEYRWFLFRAVPIRNENRNVLRWYGTNTDIEDLKRAESLLASEKQTLEMIVSGATLEDILRSLCGAIDSQNSKFMSSVALVDHDTKRLRFVAGSRVPAGWAETVNSVKIDSPLSSCGRSEFLKERVIVSDIAGDPSWAKFRDIAVSNGLRAAWSQPLISKNNETLGTFCLYQAEPSEPTESDLELIRKAARVALVAIEGDRAQAALTRAQHDLKTERDRLRLLFEIQQALVANLDLRSLFEALTASIRRVTECTAIGLALPDSVSGGLRQELIDFPESQRAITEGMLLPLDGSASGKAFRTRQLVRLDYEANRPDPAIYGTPEGEEFYKVLRQEGAPAGYFLPLIHRNEVIAVIQLMTHADGILKTQQADFLLALAGQLSAAVASALEHRAVIASRDQLAREQIYLREEIDRSSMFEEIVGSSKALGRVLTQVARVAPTDSTVLIFGETGTGKELIARALHRRSKRTKGPFIRVNCAAIPPSLIASELFGHEKGAFTGAQQKRLGRFELADDGTLFLDEVGELPMETQIALLRVLQEREFERVGGSKSISVDVRVVAATNRDLKAAVTAGMFREDLFYRLNVFPIEIPPLRERVDDIPLLLEYLIDRFAKKAAKKIRKIERQTLELFQAYKWPGNIREMQNVVERAVILCDGETFSVEETWLPVESSRSQCKPDSAVRGLMRIAEEQEKELVETALAESRGKVSGPAGAAARLGIPRQTLESKITSLGINKYSFKVGQ
jgi:formate hydrogenlyase transcriptional activator